MALMLGTAGKDAEGGGAGRPLRGDLAAMCPTKSIEITCWVVTGTLVYWVLFKVIFYFPNRKSTMTGESIVNVFYFLGTP